MIPPFRLLHLNEIFLSMGLLLATALPATPQAAPFSSAAPAKRVYVTERLEGPPPKINGVLDDACWSQGEWAGDYVQREPFEGAAPSLPTRIKILYDSRAIYVAIRASDPEIAKQPHLLGLRDESAGDVVGVAFDSYFNRRTAFQFNVTSGGSKIDQVVQANGSNDSSWNAIWDAKVTTDAEGWSAEYRIPLSQLRYSRSREQVWGLHSWRWIRRKQEEDNWQLIPMDNNGPVRTYGELRGIVDLPVSRRIELLPYSVVRYESLEKEPGNPYRSGAESEIEAGLDAKVGLSSDFTLDLSVNPDFGQVEADPSEINLTTFETFLSEKRPFFVEGKSMFDFGLDDDKPFYSRRLGASPSLRPRGAGFVDVPASTRILSAEKISGRTPGGFSLGLLHALTDRMETKVRDSEGRERQETAEPMSNYFVTRLQNDFSGGDTIVGGIFTGMERIGSESDLATLSRRAVTAGVDALHYWRDHTYYVDARALFSRVTGSREAIMALQTDSVHNFQRTDGDHVSVDQTARELTGDAGFVRIGKGYGLWRYRGDVSWRSPGVDFNDLGYLKTADLITSSAQLQYYDPTPGHGLRRRNVRLNVSETQNYGGDILEREVELETELSGLSNWYGWNEIGVQTERLDTRVLRGGPALRLPTKIPASFYVETDGSKATQLKLNLDGAVETEGGSHYWEVKPGISRRFGGSLRVDVKVSYENNRQAYQYAGETEVDGVTRYLMGRMDQKSLSSELRIQANFSPTLSLTYFGGPFASTGRFDEFKLVNQPRAGRARERFTPFDAAVIDEAYEGRTSDGTFRFDKPDFRWRELKSNLALKWEFRPGSTFYAVWSQHRDDDRDFGRFSAADEYRHLLGAHPNNTFLMKVSYWFPL